MATTGILSPSPRKSTRRRTSLPLAMLLREVERYRGDGIATRLFYENKVAQAISLLIAREKALGNPAGRRLNGQDRVQLENVTSYPDEHCSDEASLDFLTTIACTGRTKLKSTFRQVHCCAITEYTRGMCMREAGRLLSETDRSMHRLAGMIEYSTSSRFAELFRKGTGLVPSEYRRMTKESEYGKTRSAQDHRQQSRTTAEAMPPSWLRAMRQTRLAAPRGFASNAPTESSPFTPDQPSLLWRESDGSGSDSSRRSWTSCPR